MKIFPYFCSLVVAILCIALAFEFGLDRLLPESYRGYLVEEDRENVKWIVGPLMLSKPRQYFNTPIAVKKPDDTIRIVALGASGTEGWLSAKAVFNMYSLQWEAKTLSSYSRAIEFSMNEIAMPSSKKIEVINLGIAAYNITDVIRMLKDSLQLEPDLLLIQIGGNETWTTDRSKWSSYLDDDIPYLNAEIGYEILADIQAGWKTLSGGEDAFNPLALFQSSPQPIVMEPLGRALGSEHRLTTYRTELGRLGKFIKSKEIPALFLIPSQNISDFQPFGSMAKVGTSEQQLEELNQLLIEALAEPGPQAKQKYLEILEIDDGIAEANFQLGKIYLLEKNTDKAREHFWKANDRDLVLKRLPSPFHDISREFVTENSFPYIDVMEFYESKSSNGVVGYNWLDDDVHPSREAQFDLGNEIIKMLLNSDLLQPEYYKADLNRLPTFEEYNEWTGFDQESVGAMAYLKAVHNYYAFGRYRQRMKWDPNPELFLDPILELLDIANTFAPNDSSLYFSAVLNFYLDRQEETQRIIQKMNCQSSAKRAAQVHRGVVKVFWTIIGRQPKIAFKLGELLDSEGCSE